MKNTIKTFKELEPTAKQAYRNFPKKLKKYDAYDAMIDIYCVFHLRYEECQFIFKRYIEKGAIDESDYQIAMRDISVNEKVDDPEIEDLFY